MTASTRESVRTAVEPFVRAAFREPSYWMTADTLPDMITTLSNRADEHHSRLPAAEQEILRSLWEQISRTGEPVDAPSMVPGAVVLVLAGIDEMADSYFETLLHDRALLDLLWSSVGQRLGLSGAAARRLTFGYRELAEAGEV